MRFLFFFLFFFIFYKYLNLNLKYYIILRILFLKFCLYISKFEILYNIKKCFFKFCLYIYY
ncbi:hypothetical protein EXQ32_03200 [Clostridium botulinum]|nr:hypothetical protein [Clostridium botulinum]